ncbi:hypothetical protein FB451DRAFT_1239519 [Mycena latifolia]|nr:hypothetical protein FB451DRAFT_1239519 [Mycena latifolia]
MAPEKGVVYLARREVEWEGDKVPKRSRNDHNHFFGQFVAHTECCARVEGKRQTFSIHVAPPSDPNFIPLLVPSPSGSPSRKKELPPYYCKPCHSLGDVSLSTEDDVPGSVLTAAAIDRAEVEESQETTECTDNGRYLDVPPAEFVNRLNIKGRLYVNCRRKELILAIANVADQRTFLLRVNFGLAGHCLWIDTEQYREIVSQPPVRRGEKSFAFRIPEKFCDGPLNGHEHLVSIQAAFIRPKWTLIFVDHNVFMTFHLMQARRPFIPEHLKSGSPLWSALWSKTHGPVYSQEPDATVVALEAWRRKMLETSEMAPIFVSMRAHQDTFNGTGAQEATDQLQIALISPCMPTVYVCRDDGIWARFHETVTAYDSSRLNLARKGSRLPYTSGERPFYFNSAGHKAYLQTVTCYHRQHLGLFDPDATIQPDGSAIVIPGTTSAFGSHNRPAQVPTELRADRRQISALVQNYAITISDGVTDLVLYTPLTAQGGDGWPTIMVRPSILLGLFLTIYYISVMGQGRNRCRRNFQ